MCVCLSVVCVKPKLSKWFWAVQYLSATLGYFFIRKINLRTRETSVSMWFSQLSVLSISTLKYLMQCKMIFEWKDNYYQLQWKEHSNRETSHSNTIRRAFSAEWNAESQVLPFTIIAVSSANNSMLQLGIES